MISPQAALEKSMDSFYEYLTTKRPEFMLEMALTGRVVFSPQELLDDYLADGEGGDL